MKILAVIPFIPDGPEDILLSTVFDDHLQQLLKMLQACGSIKKIVLFCRQNRNNLTPRFSDDLQFIQDESADKISSRAWPNSFSPWPASIKIPEEMEAILVLNPRNPLLKTASLKKAIDYFQSKSLEALTSVVVSVHHPCQLFSGRQTACHSADIFLADQQQYAQKVFFPEDSCLWRRNTDHSITNQLTKRTILGRQDFPETVEPDGTFLIASKKWFLKAPGNKRHKVYGFKLAEQESISLMNRFDFLRYRAVLKAIAHKNAEVNCLK